MQSRRWGVILLTVLYNSVYQMKKHCKIHRTLLFALFCFAFIGTTQAQTSVSEGKAILNEKGKVVLQNKEKLTYNNFMDISAMKFEKSEKATEHFSKKNTELVTFVVDLEKKTVNIQIELRARPDWTIEDWNKYLEKL